MKYIFIAILGFIAFCIIKAATRASQGMKYLRHCRNRFHELVAQGYNQKEALITLSKEKHPELNDQVYQEIVDKCPDIIRLANFIHNVLDFRPPWQSGYGGKLSNDEAKALIQFTTVSEGGKVNTNYSAVKEELQQK